MKVAIAELAAAKGDVSIPLPGFIVMKEIRSVGWAGSHRGFNPVAGIHCNERRVSGSDLFGDLSVSIPLPGFIVMKVVGIQRNKRFKIPFQSRCRDSL